MGRLSQKIWFVHNFWREGPIGLRPNMPNMAKYASLAHILACQIWSNGVFLKRSCKMQLMLSCCRCCCHCCKWSSWGSCLLQMIIRRIRPLANDHPEDPALCKWSSGGYSHLQMIIWRDRPLANDHPEDLASYKWSSVTPVTLITSPRI